ncbi:hypothetical protein HG530_002423 [Fusarium avenaceum]|nr:hypothetical protein HG530_002423 [Fusarium avenaceum]
MAPAQSCLALEELVVRNGLAELLALVKTLHKHSYATVNLAEDILRGHKDAVKHELAGVAATHAHLVELASAAEALALGVHNKGCDSLGGLLRLRLCVHHDNIGVRAIGDPHLGSVQHVATVYGLCCCPHTDNIAAGAGLGHGQRADTCTGDETRQVLLLLLG